MKLTLIGIYLIYIAIGVALRYSVVQNYLNRLKSIPDELYSFMSRLFIFLGAAGLITYVIIIFH